MDYHALGALSNTCLFSYCPGDWKFKIKVPVGSDSREGPLPGLWTATFLLCLHMVGREKLRLAGISFYHSFKSGLTFVSSFNLHYFLTGSVAKYKYSDVERQGFSI